MSTDPIDTEALAVAVLLYSLRERLADEGKHDAPANTLATLARSLGILDTTARRTVLGLIDLDHADAILDAAELTLRSIIEQRHHRIRNSKR